MKTARGSSIHHSYKEIIHWARKDFSNFSQAETRIAHGDIH
jgi:hypothetical protein